MRRLINYIRQCFCKHDWVIEESYYEEYTQMIGFSKESSKLTRQGTKVYMRCKKCGYHTNHWKY